MVCNVDLRLAPTGIGPRVDEDEYGRKLKTDVKHGQHSTFVFCLIVLSGILFSYKYIAIETITD